MHGSYYNDFNDNESWKMHTKGVKSRGGNPKEVSRLLENLRLPASVKDHLRHSEVWTRWFEIVGTELSRVTSPLELKSKILFVTVAHQAWAQQLHFLKASLLNKIRLVCEESQINDIQFRVGKVLPVPFVPRSDFRLLKNEPLSERQEMTLRAVEDPDLRDSIRRAMAAAQANPKNISSKSMPSNSSRTQTLPSS